MSAFGGKADVRELPAVCPLIARSGHSLNTVLSHSVLPKCFRRQPAALSFGDTNLLAPSNENPSFDECPNFVLELFPEAIV